MPTKIFVNLPVRNLDKSTEFFEKLGFGFNAQFTDETAACMVVSDDIFVMLLTHEKFKTFTPKEVCDGKKSTEVLVCLSCESRANVDELVRKAVAAGGATYNDPQDHGFCTRVRGSRRSHLGADFIWSRSRQKRAERFLLAPTLIGAASIAE